MAEAGSMVLGGSAAADSSGLTAVGRRRPAAHETDALAFDERLAAFARDHFAYVWRVIRRLGVGEDDADDLAQVVFLGASKRLADIRPEAERSFLYKMAIHAVYKHRRTELRRREDLHEDFDIPAEASDGFEELVDRRRAREMLDNTVAAMPLDLRVVFVLFEVEGLSTTEIAEIVGIPAGTAASRLRRARADFEGRIARFEARTRARGGRDD